MSDLVSRRDKIANRLAAALIGTDIDAVAKRFTELVEEWHSLFLFSPENVGPSAPWEPGMFDPFKHEESTPSYLWRAFPLPWKGHGRGNAHVDFYDADGNFFVHIYFWDQSYQKAWDRIVQRVQEHHKTHDK